MKYVRSIDIDGQIITKNEIQLMSPDQIHLMCGFLDEKELRFVQMYCDEKSKVIIDNIIFKL